MSYQSYPELKDSGVEWLGEIPAHWEVKRMRFVCEINPSKAEIFGLPADHLVSFLPMEKVGTEGEIILDEARLIGDVLQGFTYFRDQDVIVAKITPCFENGKGALCQNLINGIGFGSTEFHVLRPRPGHDPKFIFYLAKSELFRSLGEALMIGSAGQKRVPEEFVSNFVTSFPPLNEQQTIAAFLDRKTAELDELIQLKERQIELLGAKRQALISHAVTRGLDPSVKMRPSGIEWLGEIPAHWKVTRLKYATSHIIDCHHSTPAYIPDGEYPAIRTADVTPGKLQLSEAKCVSEEEYLERISRLTPRKDDILYSREGERFGIAALVPPETKLCLGQRMMIFRANRFYVPDFLMWQLNSASVYAQAEQDTIGSTSPHVNVETICNFRLTEPPFEEQFRIVEFINGECKVIDDSDRLVREQIEQLRLYRQALISAAVTGKIDVRGVSL